MGSRRYGIFALKQSNVGCLMCAPQHSNMILTGSLTNDSKSTSSLTLSFSYPSTPDLGYASASRFVPDWHADDMDILTLCCSSPITKPPSSSSGYFRLSPPSPSLQPRSLRHRAHLPNGRLVRTPEWREKKSSPRRTLLSTYRYVDLVPCTRVL